MRIIGLFLAAAVGLLAGPALGQSSEQKVIDRIVAVVDDEIILESELFQYVQFGAGSQAALDAMSPAVLDSFKQRVLNDLIDQKVLLARARTDTNVVVAPRDIDSELDRRIKALADQAGGQDKLEEYYGMPLVRLKKQFRPLVEEAMLVERVKQEKLKELRVSPSEVRSFWEMYKDSIPPLKDAIRIAHILLQDSVSESSVQLAKAKADSARQKILAGEMTFEEFASRYSEDPGTASKGGRLGLTTRGDLVPEYEAAAFAMEPGQISEPVVSSFGVHLIRLDERLGEKISTHHILFKIVPDSADLARTMTRADSILQALRKGADFAKLVTRYSADAKTSAKAGDLGWFSPEELPPEFQGVLAGLKVNAVAGPVRTQFGVHILLVEGRTFARAITLEEDYDRIQRMALAKKQDEVLRQWVAELAKETYIERK